MSSSKAVVEEHSIPDVIRNSRANISYLKGKFFGKGGFAKCYELIHSRSKESFAGKIVSKKLLVKSNQKEKMLQEIEIHKSLNHKHVVGFHSYFEDNHFVYIILELCKKRSLMELHKRRKALTEPEVRFFMDQILNGVHYLHENSIIHRDLKLGNLFLNDRMEVKIGDFGLAARIQYSGQRKKTLCGTPNYIAPEILNKKGHSFEVDVWSLGCIMYTFLVGRPPFETDSLKDTYSKIKRCDYSLPPQINPLAATMIHQMLLPDPSQRPSVETLMKMDFMKCGYCPKELPVSCLNTAPRFDHVSDADFFRQPLREINSSEQSGNTENLKPGMPRPSIQASAMPVQATVTSVNCTDFLKHLQLLLAPFFGKNVKSLPENNSVFLEEISDPSAQPFVWISKWVDYSDKYGFGYQLADDGVGVMFNDHTKFVLLADQRNVHYIEADGKEHYYILGSTPPQLDKKMKLLSYFRRYMNEHLMKAGSSVALQESDSLSRIPYLHFWVRSSTAVIMQLTNGMVQYNFMDHTKMMLCPLLDAVSYIDTNKNFRTYRFTTLLEKGCPDGLIPCLQYAYLKMPQLLEAKVK